MKSQYSRHRMQYKDSSICNFAFIKFKFIPNFQLGTYYDENEIRMNIDGSYEMNNK